MSNFINTVQLSGNLGKAPEFRPEVGNGMATFNLANNRYIPREGENGTEFSKRTSWFRCVAWGSVAEKVATLTKGARVLVTGRLESRSWQDKQGNLRSSVEIVVENIQLLETIRAESGKELAQEASGSQDEDLDYTEAGTDEESEVAEEEVAAPPPAPRRQLRAVAAAKAPAPQPAVQAKPQPRYGIKAGAPTRAVVTTIPNQGRTANPTKTPGNGSGSKTRQVA